MLDRLLDFCIGLTLACIAAALSSITLWLASGEVWHSDVVAWSIACAFWGAILLIAWRYVCRVADAEPATPIDAELAAHRRVYLDRLPMEYQAAA